MTGGTGTGTDGHATGGHCAERAEGAGARICSQDLASIGAHVYCRTSLGLCAVGSIAFRHTFTL